MCCLPTPLRSILVIGYSGLSRACIRCTSNDKVFFFVSQEFQTCWKLSVAQSWSHVVSVASFHMWGKTCLCSLIQKKKEEYQYLLNMSCYSELNNNRFEVSHVHKVECVVPWLNDTLVFLTISLQLCQQLKDKVGI